MFQVNESMFSEKIAIGKPMVVLFSADWCMPCRTLKNAMPKFEEKYKDKVGFYKIDTDSCQDVSADYKITGIPTLVFIREGKENSRLVGIPSDIKIYDHIDEILI